MAQRGLPLPQPWGSTSLLGSVGAMSRGPGSERVVGEEGRASAEESLREADSEDTALMLGSKPPWGFNRELPAQQASGPCTAGPRDASVLFCLYQKTVSIFPQFSLLRVILEGQKPHSTGRRKYNLEEEKKSSLSSLSSTQASRDESVQEPGRRSPK